ncbi:antibiotic resistance protein VanZ [Xylella taiwanensis]|uniref:Antibiotic resistance protein VanZ n=2 Tax=Xylella taiwanensis TaxID=1444770 RepID=Z9JI31_9GAMM|nr:antibiotic resistance protein VanZ [Xylella taiwanensis]EWS77417.1 antibiotic resistance protein VanZ [Xylella taiwanensis]MCD8461703.1 antibiotic resistance protein VanZ [Xylella taiwanensis]MCD8466052.1 antibiotic resistance protein VanZ [Xylella taiwanensis]MCD8468625.1 antibiotic resistance protein VanZ [Xylella taiwanensis]MCD8469035.1 antibiotic resistance protein VanZ [Xylella taiwanensis]
MLWLCLWITAILAVIIASLLPQQDLPQVPAGVDKVEHLLSYFLLAWWAAALFARPLIVLAVGAGLVLLGIGIEFAQAAFTIDRIADAADALANMVGVVLGLLMRLTPLGAVLVRLDASLFSSP